MCSIRPFAISSLLAVILAFSSALGQDSPAGDEALRVFIDCSGFRCDLDYVRQQVQFVSYVRDRTDAQLHVLITTQSTGSGGREFTLRFIGKKRFSGWDDTLTHTALDTETQDEVRQGLVRVFKAGLMRYISQTPLIDDITIAYAAGPEEERPSPDEDSWNYWVFETSVRGYFNGEQQQNRRSLSGSVSANRTTHDWKMDFSISGNFTGSSFQLSSDRRVRSNQRSFQAQGLVVRSISNHWSAGFKGNSRISTYSNYDLSSGLAPAIEYNLFPYSVSTNKQLRFLYSVETSYFNYTQETLFNKLSERRLSQSLDVTADINQPWGSLRTSLEGSHYFHDWSKHKLDLFTNLDLRIFRGLSLNLFGSVALIRDQLNLPKQTATTEEILLRRRELATNYRYYLSMGLRYKFGSIYNNIVNPRFGR
jgi:hypothetical protein